MVEVLKRTAASAMRRRTEDGPLLAVGLLSDVSQVIFQGLIPSSYHCQDSVLVPDQLFHLLSEGSMAG